MGLNADSPIILITFEHQANVKRTCHDPTHWSPSIKFKIIAFGGAQNQKVLLPPEIVNTTGATDRW